MKKNKIKTKYSLYDELINDNNLLSHVFMECTPRELIIKIADKNIGKSEDKIEATKVDLKLYVNDTQVEAEKFFQHLFDQYSSMVERRAIELIKEKTSGKLQEYQDKIMEMGEVLNSWTDEINWNNVDNPFVKDKV